MGIVLTDIYGGDIAEPSRVFNFKFSYWEVMLPAFEAQGADSVNTNQQTNSVHTKPEVVVSNIESNSCDTMEKINPGFKESNKFYTNKVCVDFGKNNITLAGKVGSIRGYKHFVIYLNKCVNSTGNGNHCLPQAHIDNVLSQGILSVFTTEFDIDTDNINAPLQEYHTLDQIQITTSIFKLFVKKYNKIFLNYDSGLLTPAIERLEAYKTDSISEAVDLKSANNFIPGNFNQISFQGSGKNEIFNISFMKLPQMLANIGGILQLTIFVGRVLMYFWSTNSMLEFVISKVFTEEERKKHLLFYEENKTKQLNVKNISVKDIFSNKEIKSNLNFSKDNIEQIDKNKEGNDSLNPDESLSKIDKSKIAFVNCENNFGVNLQNLKTNVKPPKKNSKHRVIKNVQILNQNLEINQEINQQNNINEIKKVISSTEYNAKANKKTRNQKLILRDNNNDNDNNQELKKIEDGDLSNHGFYQEEM